MKRNFKKSCSAFLILSCFSLAGAETIHEVKKGETLYSISRNYGVSVDSVKRLNNFTGNDIKIGQKIKIPDNAKTADSADSASKDEAKTSSAADSKSASSKAEASVSSDGTYVVQKGETWFGISKKYGITVAELQKMNGADSSSSLKIGQKLKVPSSDSKSSSSVAKSTDGSKSDSSNSPSVSSSKSSSASSSSKDSKSNSSASVNVPEIGDPHKYSSKKGDSSLIWPVKTTDVTYIKGKVGGVSLLAKKDESVTAIRAGTVMFSGSYRGFGNVVFIQSKTGHIYAYTGLGSIEVSKGEYVNYASQIGTAGVDSYTGKSQVNLMVFQNGQPIDPAKAPRG